MRTKKHQQPNKSKLTDMNNIYNPIKNKNIISSIAIIVILFASIPVKAQDPHYSQYFTSPMTVNPALIGKGVDDGRLMANYRSQWWGGLTQPYSTMTVSFEKRLAAEKLNANSSLAMGLMMLSDQSNGGLLKNNFFSGGIAYNQALDGAGNQQLGAGIAVTYANRLLDPNMFLFQSQFGSMGFQRNIPANDGVAIQNNKYWDVNVGAHYSSVINEKIAFNLGAAMFHVARPVEGAYSGTGYQINSRINVQAGLQYHLQNKSEVDISSMLESQNGFTIYSLGAVYKVRIEDETLTSLNIGLWNRFGDAFYPYLGLEANKWLAGISYDAVSSKVKTVYSSVSSAEFSFAWKFGKKTNASANKKSILYY